MIKKTIMNAEPRAPSAAQDIFSSNLTSVVEQFPYLIDILEPILPACSIVLEDETSPAGVTVRWNDKERIFSGEKSAANLLQIPNPEKREPIFLINGLGAGYELVDVFSKTRQPYPEMPTRKVPIYVIETDPLALLATLAAQDLTHILAEERVLFFIGHDAIANYQEYILLNRQAMLPQVLVSQWYPGNHPQNIGVTETTNHLINQTDKTIEQLEQRVRRYYDGITPERWKSIYTTNERPLRILACASRFTTFTQYCLRDLLAGFDELGHETRLHNEKSDIFRSTKYDILATLEEFKPDLIIYIDHLRGEFPFIPNNVPFVSWIQDMLPRIIRPEHPTIGEFDFTFVFSELWQKDLASIPFYRDHPTFLLPIGINANIYKPLEDTEKTIDILYVSHLGDPSNTLQPLRDNSIEFTPNKQEIDLLERNALTFEQLLLCYMLIIRVLDNTLIDDLDRYRNSPDLPSTKLPFTKRILEQAGLPASEDLVSYFSSANRIILDLLRAFKIRPIRALLNKGLNIHVYGNHWEAYPEFKSVAYGPASNGPMLNELMNKARICINNSPGTSLHMRALEIMGSGAFMLSRDIQYDNLHISDYIPKEELALFNNEIDIFDKAAYYLSNDELRATIALKNRTRALELFGYPMVATNIRQTIVDRLTMTHFH
jgi:hypothetical protein